MSKAGLTIGAIGLLLVIINFYVGEQKQDKLPTPTKIEYIKGKDSVRVDTVRITKYLTGKAKLDTIYIDSNRVQVASLDTTFENPDSYTELGIKYFNNPLNKFEVDYKNIVFKKTITRVDTQKMYIPQLQEPEKWYKKFGIYTGIGLNYDLKPSLNISFGYKIF